MELGRSYSNDSSDSIDINASHIVSKCEYIAMVILVVLEISMLTQFWGKTSCG